MSTKRRVDLPFLPEPCALSAQNIISPTECHRLIWDICCDSSSSISLFLGQHGGHFIHFIFQSRDMNRELSCVPTWTGWLQSWVSFLTCCGIMLFWLNGQTVQCRGCFGLSDCPSFWQTGMGKKSPNQTLNIIVILLTDSIRRNYFSFIHFIYFL